MKIPVFFHAFDVSLSAPDSSPMALCMSRRSVMRMLRLLMQSAIGELSGADKETSKA